jgi:hypothetical protein
MKLHEARAIGDRVGSHADNPKLQRAVLLEFLKDIRGVEDTDPRRAIRLLTEALKALVTATIQLQRSKRGAPKRGRGQKGGK